MRIVANWDEIKRYETQLERMAKYGVRFAMRDTLNNVAFEARRLYQLQASQHMILRSPWTKRSMRVTKSKSIKAEFMKSTVGSVEQFMQDQEFGKTETKKGTHGVPIPTAVAAGQPMGSHPITRGTRGRNQLAAISLGRGGVSGTRAQRNAIAIRKAADTGGFAFLDLGRRQGIFSVMGRPKKSDKGGAQVRMVWDLSHDAITLKPNPMLYRASVRANSYAPIFYRRALREQLMRAKSKGM